MGEMKWEHAFIQQGGEVCEFIETFLKKPDRKCALICGAGFDPRTLNLTAILGDKSSINARVLCLREERIKPQPLLRPKADFHELKLKERFGANCFVEVLNMFDHDGAVVGGRQVVPIVNRFIDETDADSGLTDILIDISALSCGVFFPIVAQILAKRKILGRSWNIHLFVTESPAVDVRIRGEIVDFVTPIHGFHSRESMSQSSDHAILWVPVLSEGNDTQLRQIFREINQSSSALDVSPIVPFPGLDPRRPDILVENYRELIGEWQVDPRHFLYAAESDPLDSYRTICMIDKLRKSTFGRLGGSSTIVSPLGSKMLSVGLLLASIERGLRVVYSECVGYDELQVPKVLPLVDADENMTHIWLEGEVYAGFE